MSGEGVRDWWVRAAGWVLVGVLVVFVVFCGVWRVSGGRWERVETPSMGMVAPVGTLLWVRPVAFGSLRVGDFITFHPPGRPGVTYSHRVYARNADGTISTKGVIPAPDPWRLGAGDVVGQVRMRWWGVGWLVAAAPVLLGGFLVVAVVRRVLRREWRLPATMLLGAVVVTAAIVYYRPFLNAEQLAAVPVRSGGAEVTYVGTGLLPIRLSARDGASVVMRAGEVGTVRVSKADLGRRSAVSLSPAVPWWVWCGLVLSCFLPALYSLLVGFAPRPEDVPARHREVKE